jgi:hypothetical protein
MLALAMIECVIYPGRGNFALMVEDYLSGDYKVRLYER